MNNRISTFTFKGKDIDVLFNKGNLAYTFEHEGKQYGFKMELTTKKTLEIVSVTWLLLQNAIETIEALGIN